MLASIYSCATGIYNQASHIRNHRLCLFLTEQVKKIQNISQPIFASISSSIHNINQKFSNDNSKVLAMIGCIALITILVLSFLRKKEPDSKPHE